MSTQKPTVEERLSAIENQSFIMYLQLNAITKILVDKGVVDKDKLTAEMDDLNKQLYEITMQMVDNENKQAGEDGDEVTKDEAKEE